MIPAVSLPSTTVTIDNEIYTIQLLDAVTASDLYFKLINAVGGAFSSVQALDVSGNLDEDKAAQSDLAIRAIGALMKGVPPALLAECRDTFANSCTVQKQAASPKLSTIFAFHFAGRMAHMSKWLFECVKANFADFLDGALVSQVLTKFQGTKPASPSPPA